MVLTIPFNDEGNIFTKDNRSTSDRIYAKIQFEKINGVNVDNSAVINNMKIYISNDFDQAYNKELTASISYILLQDKDNNYVIRNSSSPQTYSATLTSSSPVEIYNKSINSTYGALSDSNVYLRLAFQLENYISDYKNHATDIYSVTYNGEVATDDELQFLKEQGFKSITYGLVDISDSVTIKYTVSYDTTVYTKRETVIKEKTIWER